LSSSSVADDFFGFLDLLVKKFIERKLDRSSS